jgi:polynucleotide 5'-hydroxyl-kinase GRC3/NOL9
VSTVLEKDKALLVEGPASVVLQEGRVTALGARLPLGKAVVIRKGKALPLEAEEEAHLKVNAISGHVPLLLDGSTIPKSWREAISQIDAEKVPTVMVLGASDCGKNTFCIALVNKLAKGNVKIAIIDGDVGQSDIGPPAAVSFSVVRKPVFDLFDLKPRSAVFVGNTSPSGVSDRVLAALASLNDEVKGELVSHLIVNTDGLVTDEGAVDFKLHMAEIISPQVVVGIQRDGELEPILSALEGKGNRVLRVEAPAVVCHRNREMRRELREQCFRKFLVEASVRTLPLGWLRLEYTFLNQVEADTGMRNTVSKLLDSPVVWCATTEQGLRVVVPRDSKVDKASILETERVLKVPVRVVFEGEEKGLIVALLDKEGKFGGLGAVHSINFQNGTIKVYTPYLRMPSVIQFGRIRLSESGRESEYTEDFEP